jgi:hypothetical protein
MFALDASTLATVLVSLLLLLGVAAMMVWHVRAWRTLQQLELDNEEFDYRRRQYRRRMQTSAMFGLLAIALGAANPLLSLFDAAWFVITYWCVSLLLVCWIILLALVDMWATQHHFGRQQQQVLLEEAKLKAEVRSLQTGNHGDR